MRSIKGLILVLGFAVLIASPSVSSAALVTFNDPALFASQGTIVQNYGFEDFPAGTFSFPGDPWTTHGVTYTTGHNLIVGAGPGTSYNAVSNVFINNFWTPLTGDIDSASQFTMAGFDLAYLAKSSLMSLDVYTNLNTYTFSNENVPNVADGLKFYGAVTTGGEYLTGFSITSNWGAGSAPAIDNVRLGYAGSAVPEPASLSLLGLGLLGMVFKRKRTA